MISIILITGWSHFITIILFYLHFKFRKRNSSSWENKHDDFHINKLFLWVFRVYSIHLYLYTEKLPLWTSGLNYFPLFELCVSQTLQGMTRGLKISQWTLHTLQWKLPILGRARRMKVFLKRSSELWPFWQRRWTNKRRKWMSRQCFEEGIDANSEATRRNEGAIEQLKRKVAELQGDTKRLRKAVAEHAQYKRRWNLRLDGLAEKDWEDSIETVIGILTRVVPIAADHLHEDVDMVRHLGRNGNAATSNNTTRPIILPFLSRVVRDEVWKVLILWIISI